MRINLGTVDVLDSMRFAIARFFGLPVALAPVDTCRDWLRDNGYMADISDSDGEYEAWEASGRPRLIAKQEEEES